MTDNLLLKTEAERILSDSAKFLRAEIDRLRAEREWRPIETAPRDGTKFLWVSGNMWAVIRWPEYESCFDQGHWQPLPAPPVNQAAPE